MTIEQKKISLINWITNLEDEKTLDLIAKVQKSSFEELPKAIIKLLKLADEEPEEKLVKHSSSKDILNIK